MNFCEFIAKFTAVSSKTFKGRKLIFIDRKQCIFIDRKHLDRKHVTVNPTVNSVYGRKQSDRKLNFDIFVVLIFDLKLIINGFSKSNTSS